MKIFCLIPAYNEKGNIEALTEKLVSEFIKQKTKYAILFVIQGDDGSREILDKLKRKNKNIKYLFFKKPLGIGNAYKVGFQSIDPTCTHVFTLDADLNHNPKYFPQFVSTAIKTKADVVIGSRYMSGGKFLDTRMWKRVISLLMNKFITTILSIPVHDISSGFRLIKINVITKVLPKLRERNYPAYMEFIMYSHKAHFKLREISIVYTPRSWGKSKMNSVNTLRDYLLFLPRIVSFIR